MISTSATRISNPKCISYKDSTFSINALRHVSVIASNFLYACFKMTVALCHGYDKEENAVYLKATAGD